MPFVTDEFGLAIEQLAGDLLPNSTPRQRLATGFNRNHGVTIEGGIIDEEYRVLYARDRTETTSQVWLGMTTGCAVCHSHKFDPLSQREFYELADTAPAADNRSIRVSGWARNTADGPATQRRISTAVLRGVQANSSSIAWRPMRMQPLDSRLPMDSGLDVP